eukprot:3782350-Amphidinium_carterae.1
MAAVSQEAHVKQDDDVKRLACLVQIKLEESAAADEIIEALTALVYACSKQGQRREFCIPIPFKSFRTNKGKKPL